MASRRRNATIIFYYYMATGLSINTIMRLRPRYRSDCPSGRLPDPLQAETHCGREGFHGVSWDSSVSQSYSRHFFALAATTRRSDELVCRGVLSRPIGTSRGTGRVLHECSRRFAPSPHRLAHVSSVTHFQGSSV